MNTLLAMVRDIALLVLICSFWEMLAPQGKLRPMVRLVIGLLLVSFIIMPISDFLNRGLPEVRIDFTVPTDTETVLLEGMALAANLENLARHQYETELARQVAALGTLVEGVTDIRLALTTAEHSGIITQIYLEASILPKMDAMQVQSRLINLISVFYGLEEHLIEVMIREVD